MGNMLFLKSVSTWTTLSEQVRTSGVLSDRRCSMSMCAGGGWRGSECGEECLVWVSRCQHCPLVGRLSAGVPFRWCGTTGTVSVSSRLVSSCRQDDRGRIRTLDPDPGGLCRSPAESHRGSGCAVRPAAERDCCSVNSVICSGFFLLCFFFLPLKEKMPPWSHRGSCNFPFFNIFFKTVILVWCVRWTSQPTLHLLDSQWVVGG